MNEDLSKSQTVSDPMSIDTPDITKNNKSDDPKKLGTKDKEFEPSKSRSDLIRDIHESNAKLVERYRADGPFVYELFGCLVHRGDAMGGHYFAYIFDHETRSWWNFDDTRVSKVDECDLVEMFGSAKKQMHGSTNAYMLMYRLVDGDVSELSVTDIPAEI